MQVNFFSPWEYCHSTRYNFSILCSVSKSIQLYENVKFYILISNILLAESICFHCGTFWKSYMATMLGMGTAAAGQEDVAGTTILITIWWMTSHHHYNKQHNISSPPWSFIPCLSLRARKQSNTISELLLPNILGRYAEVNKKCEDILKSWFSNYFLPPQRQATSTQKLQAFKN